MLFALYAFTTLGTGYGMGIAAMAVDLPSAIVTGAFYTGMAAAAGLWIKAAKERWI